MKTRLAHVALVALLLWGSPASAQEPATAAGSVHSFEFLIAPIFGVPLGWAPGVRPTSRSRFGGEFLMGWLPSDNVTFGLHLAGWLDRGWSTGFPGSPGEAQLPVTPGVFGEVRLPLLSDPERLPRGDVLTAGLFMRVGYPYVRTGVGIRWLPFRGFVLGVDLAHEYLLAYAGTNEHSVVISAAVGRRLDLDWRTP